MEAIHKFVEGKIDFQGQRLCDRIMQESLVAGALISFLLGYFTQSMQLCMLTFGASTLLVALVTVPAWGFYNKHHVEWLPSSSKLSTEAAESESSQEVEDSIHTSTGKGRGKGKKTVTVKTSITTQVS